MSKLYAPFHAALADRDAAARAWKAAGGKVIGYMGNTVPTELIVAAGAFPLRLTAEADETPLADRYMEALFDPVVRAVFETLLAGGYDFLDAVVLPRTSDSLQRLYYYLCEVRRMGEADLPETLLYDLLHTPWYSSAEYSYARTGELAAAMARITGTTPDEPALRQAIAAGNQRRGLLTQLVERRRAIIPLVSGADARAVFAASQVMTTEAFDAALERALAAAAPVVVGPRIVLAGSGQHTGALHEMIEGELAVVVGDFHEFGEPMIGGPIDETAPPLRAITAHYHRTVASSRSFPQSSEPLAQFARDAGAEGVIFYFFQEEEALTWEYPAQREALHAAGIATLCFEGMPPRPQAAEIGRAVAGFIDGLRQGVRP